MRIVTRNVDGPTNRKRFIANSFFGTQSVARN